MTEQENQQTPPKIEETPMKKVSEKQYEHLVKAREAKKRKQADLIKSDIEFIKTGVLNLQENIQKLKEPVSPDIPNKKVKLYDYLVDPITVACVSLLAFTTLGTVWISRYGQDENPDYNSL